MADIVIGIASSHTPQLSSGVDMWHDHSELLAAADPVIDAPPGAETRARFPRGVRAAYCAVHSDRPAVHPLETWPTDTRVPDDRGHRRGNGIRPMVVSRARGK